MVQNNERTAVAVPDGRFTEGYIEADGFRIRYQEAGQGEPLVSLHGAGVCACLDPMCCSPRSIGSLSSKCRALATRQPMSARSPCQSSPVP